MINFLKYFIKNGGSYKNQQSLPEYATSLAEIINNFFANIEEFHVELAGDKIIPGSHFVKYYCDLLVYEIMAMPDIFQDDYQYMIVDTQNISRSIYKIQSEPGYSYSTNIAEMLNLLNTIGYEEHDQFGRITVWPVDTSIQILQKSKNFISALMKKINKKQRDQTRTVYIHRSYVERLNNAIVITLDVNGDIVIDIDYKTVAVDFLRLIPSTVTNSNSHICLSHVDWINYRDHVAHRPTIYDCNAKPSYVRVPFTIDLLHAIAGVQNTHRFLSAESDDIIMIASTLIITLSTCVNYKKNKGSINPSMMEREMTQKYGFFAPHIFLITLDGYTWLDNFIFKSNIELKYYDSYDMDARTAYNLVTRTLFQFISSLRGYLLNYNSELSLLNHLNQDQLFANNFDISDYVFIYKNGAIDSFDEDNLRAVELPYVIKWGNNTSFKNPAQVNTRSSNPQLQSLSETRSSRIHNKDPYYRADKEIENKEISD